MTKLKKLFRNKPLLLTILFLATVYFLLVFKDPYSSRSLIPNLEPFPDTLYYSDPAWNFARGKGFTMQAFDYQSKIITPPLYSFFLIPFFAIFSDIRSYYFANLLLGLTSLGLFIAIIRKIYRDKFSNFLVGFLGFLYVTNFFIFTIPTMLMAENLTLTLSLLAAYLLLVKSTGITSSLSALLGIALLLIKFSNLPLAAAFYALYTHKIFMEKTLRKIGRSFIFSFVFAIFIFVIYLTGSQILTGHKNLSSGNSFSLGYFMGNLKLYLGTLSGEYGYFLWHNSARSSNLLLALLSSAGIIIGIVSKKSRLLNVRLMLYALSLLLFMSFFYAVDIRFISAILPIFFIFIGNGFYFLKGKLNNFISSALMIFVIILYLFLPQLGQIQNESNLVTFKKQVGLNFKYKEEPWNYLAVSEFNKYFYQKENKNTYLATFLSPYFMSFYANGNYDILPITQGQEFFEDKINNEEYKKEIYEHYLFLLEQGNEIFISPYYQGNVASWKNDYESLIEHFEVEKVSSGCLSTCNIYRLHLPEE